MSYTLRELTIEDFEASVALSSYAFRVELNEEQKNQRRANFINDSFNRYGVFEGEQLCSQLLLYHYECIVQGKPIKASGVASVSSWPEYRRNGYVSKLLEQSLVKMREQGELISILHPFSIHFYRKFGYEILSQRIKHSMPITYIKRQDLAGKITRETNYLELKEMYEQYSKAYNGMLVRDHDHWVNYLPNKKKGNIVVYRNEQEQKRGYMIFNITTKMTILEFVALDKEAYDALWSFVGQHDSMVNEVEWYTPYSDYQFSELQDPRISREVEQNGMVRIVDCVAFIEQYNFSPTSTDQDEQYYINVSDRYAPWNDGLFKLTINSNGKANLEAANTEIDGDDVIKISITTLSGLLIGYYSFNHVMWNKNISGSEHVLNRLKNRIKQSDVQLVDYF